MSPRAPSRGLGARAACALCVALPAFASAERPVAQAPASVGDAVTFASSPQVFIPVGEWRRSPLAGHDGAPDDLSLYGVGGGGSVDAGIRLADLAWMWWHVTFDLTHLGSGDWEDYAARHGSDVDDSAWFWALHGGVGFDVVRVRRARLELQAELGALVAWGEEVDHTEGLTFDDDFLKAGFSVRGALLVSAPVATDFEVFAGPSVIIAPAAVHVVGQPSEPLAGILLQAGLRFWAVGEPR